jgi:hypothetical protein
MHNAEAVAISALSFIVSEDDLRDRFMALSGIDSTLMRDSITDLAFMVSVLDFLIGHEPDLMAFSTAHDIAPEHIVKAWRMLGGGVGQEW